MASHFDKIIKENFRDSLVGLMNHVVGINFIPKKKVALRLQKTVEREPDFFEIVNILPENKQKVLHVEWQLKISWKKIRNRYMLYKVLGIHVTDLPIIQYLITLGKRKPRKTVNTYKDQDMEYRFHVIPIKSISYKTFLNAPEVEVALFAILGNFEGKKAEFVIEKVTERMVREATGELDLQKWSTQLEMLANLHKLQKLTIKILERMPIIYDLKKDLRYQQGKSEGLEQGVEQGADIQATVTVINMLLKTDFPISQISDLAGVKAEFVKDWEKKLKKVKLKSLWNSFGKIEEKNKAKLVERSKAIAVTMLAIKDISLNVIAKVVELPLKMIEEIKKEEYKKNKEKGKN